MTIKFRNKLIKINEEVKAGMHVLLVDTRHKYVPNFEYPVVGSRYEALCKIKELSLGYGVAYVSFTDIEGNKRNMEFALENLVPYGEFTKQCPPIGEQRHEINNSVYLKHTPDNKPSQYWPSVGSPYEVDCKILEVYTTPLGYSRTYSLITGHGHYTHASEDFLITPSEKERLLTVDYAEFEAVEDCYPVFTKGTKFKKLGEYVVSFNGDITLLFNDNVKQDLKCIT